jgi:hypothetical protein
MKYVYIFVLTVRYAYAWLVHPESIRLNVGFGLSSLFVTHHLSTRAQEGIWCTIHWRSSHQIRQVSRQERL